MDWLAGAAFRLSVRVLSLMPLGVARGLCRRLAGLVWRSNSRATVVTRTNLTICYPELDTRARESLVRASLAETACVLAESGALFHWHERRWRALANSATASGSGALGETLASGNGALVLMPHYGNWEFLGLYLGALAEHDVLALFQPQRFSSVTQRLVAARGRSGLKLAPMDRAGIRAAYRQLGSGGCLLLLPDQVPRRAAGVYAPFFGTPALTMTLAHRLIQRTRPEVFMAVAGRTSNGFEVTIQAMDDAVYQASAEQHAGAINAAIEAVVRDDPAQYQWEYRRFRRPPAGAADPYSQT